MQTPEGGRARTHGSSDMVSFLNDSDSRFASPTDYDYCGNDDCVSAAGSRCPTCHLALCVSCKSEHRHEEGKHEVKDQKNKKKEARKQKQNERAAVGKKGKVDDKKPETKEFVFEVYWDRSKVDAELQAGKLKKGTLEVEDSKRDVAFVRCPDGLVKIDGWQHRNRSLDGDTVAIQMVSNDQGEKLGKIVFNYYPIAGRVFKGRFAATIHFDRTMFAFSCSEVRYPPFLSTLPPAAIELLKKHMVRPLFRLKCTAWDAHSKWAYGVPVNDEELIHSIKEKQKQEKAKAIKAQATPTASNAPSRKNYKAYLTEEEAAKGLANGELVQGVLRIMNPRDAFVTVKGIDRDVYLEGRKARNRAFDGDTVVIKLAPKNEWVVVGGELNTAPARRVVFEGGDEELLELDEEIPALVRQLSTETVGVPQPTGAVVHVSRRPIDPVYIGYLDQSNVPDRFALFKPLDLRAPFAFLARKDWPKEFTNSAQTGSKPYYVARFTQWRAEDTQPLCVLVGPPIGNAGSVEAETRALLTECCVNFDHNGEFSAEAMADAVKFQGWSIEPADLQGRLDLRAQRIFSINPTGAQDVDDALSVEQNSDGTVTIGVHISDVAAVLQHNTRLDTEAFFRGQAIYLVQKTLHLLPKQLSEHALSFLPGQDRLAFSVFWKMGKDGKITVDKPVFRKSVIRSCCKLDYRVAQLIIDHSPATEEGIPEELKEPLYGSMKPVDHPVLDIVSDVILLSQLAIARRKRRLAEGALALKHTKFDFHLDDQQQPVLFEARPQNESNHLVEEFLLFVNKAVADHLLATAHDVALLRRKEPPEIPKMNKVVHVLQHMGIGLQTDSAGSLQASLNHFSNSHYRGTNVKCALEKICLGFMQKAMYFCPGQLVPDLMAEKAANAVAKLLLDDGKALLPPEKEEKEEKPGFVDEFRHYSLNFPCYTHFTAPLKRYADIEVHRLLTWSLDQSQPCPIDSKTCAERADHLNFRHLWAKKAEELSAKVFLSIYLHQKHPVGYEEKALIVEMGTKALRILVYRLGLEQRINLDEIKCREAHITPEKILEIRHHDGSLEARQVFDELTLLMYGSPDPPCHVRFEVKPRIPISPLNARSTAFSPRTPAFSQAGGGSSPRTPASGAPVLGPRVPSGGPSLSRVTSASIPTMESPNFRRRKNPPKQQQTPRKQEASSSPISSPSQSTRPLPSPSADGGSSPTADGANRGRGGGQGRGRGRGGRGGRGGGATGTAETPTRADTTAKAETPAKATTPSASPTTPSASPTSSHVMQSKQQAPRSAKGEKKETEKKDT